MIEYIAGTLVSVTEKSVVVETSGGVAYRIFCNPATAPAPKDVGTAVKIFTFLKKNEMAPDVLYGFNNEKERQLFNALLKVDKVGPVLAMSILAIGEPEHILQAIRMGNVAYLQRAKGCDKKAQGIILAFAKK